MVTRSFNKRRISQLFVKLPDFPVARVGIACEQQMYFQSSLLSLRKIMQGEKRSPEIRLLFTG